VWSSIWLVVKRHLRPALARRFGVRPYAEVTLAHFPRRLPIPSRGRSIDIERAYIRLSLSASPDRRIDDEALLSSDAGSILIFGEPGSGKSSLTRKLYREELKRAFLKPFRSRLPLHLELGKLPWAEMPELVARTLLEEKIPTSLQTLADRVGERHAWHRFGPSANTFYGAVMAVATDRIAPVTPDTGPRLVGRVEVVSNVHPKQMDRRFAADSALQPVVMVMILSAMAALTVSKETANFMMLIATTLGIVSIVRGRSMRRARGGGIRIVATKAELLGLERHDYPTNEVRELFLARFGGRHVRLYAGRDDLARTQDANIDAVSRSLLMWILVACRPDGVAATSRSRRRLANLMNEAALVQAVNIASKPGPLWCVPLQPRHVISLMPPAGRDEDQTDSA
jgi:hypothetical protein